MKLLKRALLALPLLLATAASAQPVTTRAAGDVEIVVTRIDPKPTLVTASITNQSASDLFFKLAQQAGGGIVPQDESLWDDPALASGAFSAEWNKQSMWDAFREACEATSLHATLDPSNEGVGRLRLQHGSSGAPSFIDGVAMVRAQQLMRDASISYADNSRSADQVHFTMQLLLEPKFRGLAWIDSVVIDKAEDETGRALTATVPQGVGQMYGEPNAVILAYPKEHGQKIALIRGSMHVQFAREIASVRLPQPFGAGKEVTTKVGPNKVTFKSVTPDANGSWNVFLTLDCDKNETLPHGRITTRRFSTYSLSLAMLGSKGAFKPTGGSAGWDDRHSEVHQSFAPAAAGDVPSEFRVEVPMTFAPLDVKFEFEDLPLP